MRRRDFLAFLVSALGPAAYAADDVIVDGPKARFQDDLISRLEGNWRLTRRIRGKEARNTVSATWVLNHQFLLVQMKDVDHPPAYEALVLIGYIHASGQYVAHWCDTFGGKYSAKGTGVRSENAVEFQFNYDDGPFFNTFTWFPEKEQWIMRLENQDKNGARNLFAIDTLERGS